MTKPLAGVSIDLDNLWAYMKAYGDPRWTGHPSYFAEVIPTILDVLNNAQITGTFFVVGLDAANERHRSLLELITVAGHELANHSLTHDPSMGKKDDAVLWREVLESDEAITAICGSRPIGFRAPGFAWSYRLLEVISSNGYQYDSSVLPTYFGPFARQVFFLRGKLKSYERKQYAEHFGSWRNGRLPNRAFLWKLPRSTLLELPVTVFPGLRTPIHMSYVNSLADISVDASLAYVRALVRLSRSNRSELTVLLHPTDFFGVDRMPTLRVLPGMRRTSKKKQGLLSEVLAIVRSAFELGPLREVARHLLLAENYASLQGIR